MFPPNVKLAVVRVEVMVHYYVYRKMQGVQHRTCTKSVPYTDDFRLLQVEYKKKRIPRTITEPSFFNKRVLYIRLSQGKMCIYRINNHLTACFYTSLYICNAFMSHTPSPTLYMNIRGCYNQEGLI